METLHNSAFPVHNGCGIRYVPIQGIAAVERGNAFTRDNGQLRLQKPAQLPDFLLGCPRMYGYSNSACQENRH
ncbi:hypothetical protein D3C81_2039490 [compost metagenome]